MESPTREAHEIAAEAADAARAAADEARDPEARFFLRQHANLLERLAASYRRAGQKSADARSHVSALLPIAESLPL